MQPREFNPRKTFFLAALIIAFAVYTMSRSPEQAAKTTLRGHTMGTTWQAVISADVPDQKRQDIEKALGELFTDIDNQMSGWNKSSTVSTFNKHEANQPIQLGEHFHEVLTYSMELAEASDGAFDITIKPLLDVWGFGAGTKKLTAPPSQEAIDATLSKMGHQHIKVDKDELTLSKSLAELHLELNATAKGYAVEQAAELIVGMGYSNCLFEIGGEFAARGKNPYGHTWRLGVSTPTLKESGSGGSLQAAVNVNNSAMATSGDYQNYFMHGTNIFSHVIDPRTGYPAANGVASATVIAPNCMHADGLATTMMVMGVKEGIALIETLPDTEAMLIIRKDKNSFEHHFSSGFQALLKAEH